MESIWAMGLMSGTSLDGIDAALLQSDGEKVTAFGPALTMPYEPSFRAALREALGQKERPKLLEQELTRLHGEAISRLRSMTDTLVPRLIGFHGQTLFHAPGQGISVQMGDGALLAELSGIDVIHDFRFADVKAGGQGAPLVPIYHAALAQSLPKPLAVVNIGGVANVTWIGEEGEDLLAFDTGPGNALMDDWMHRHSGNSYDNKGEIAASGTIREEMLARYLSHPFFERSAPKSLDRNEWPLPEDLSFEDGMATLAAFTAASIEMAQDWFPSPAREFLITGGGRHNTHLMHLLKDRLEASVRAVEEVGWQGDFLEAQAFAFLAIRSLYNLPLSFPGTTGVKEPTRGGVYQRSNRKP